MTTRRSKRRREPSGTPAPTPQAVVDRPPQQFLLVVKNLLGQALSISFLSEAGVPETVVVPAHGESRAVEKNRISPYTHQLVSKGYARIVPAPSGAGKASG